jgi:predicted negative regulator of RcsB-dependent stress response
MDPDLFVIFGSLGITGIVLGAMALVGWRMWVHRLPQSDSSELAASLERRLKESVQEEVARALEDRDKEVEELHERLDFAERLLTQARLKSGTEEEPTAG